MKTANIFTHLPAADDREHVATLVWTSGMRIERIVSHGQCSPTGFWYDPNEDEWVILLAGAAKLAFDDGEPLHTLQAGDYFLIPAGRRHRVAWTTLDQNTIWLTIFSSEPMHSEA